MIFVHKKYLFFKNIIKAHSNAILSIFFLKINVILPRISNNDLIFIEKKKLRIHMSNQLSNQLIKRSKF